MWRLAQTTNSNMSSELSVEAFIPTSQFLSDRIIYTFIFAQRPLEMM